MDSITFRVVGEPAPQGSKRHVGRGILVEQCGKVKPWRQDVAAAALEARKGRDAMDGPLHVAMGFVLRRPPSIPKKREYPDRKPDLDKLVRSTLDAIVTAGLIADDARVVSLFAAKEYSFGQPLGATIKIRKQEPVA